LRNQNRNWHPNQNRTRTGTAARPPDPTRASRPVGLLRARYTNP